MGEKLLNLGLYSQLLVRLLYRVRGEKYSQLAKIFKPRSKISFSA